MTDIDVLIIGGGIAGASLGARLSSSLRIAIIESEDLCGRHATGRSAAFWQASLGGNTPERKLSLASKPMFDSNWPGSSTALLRDRGAVHLTGPSGEEFHDLAGLGREFAAVHLDRSELDRLIPGMRGQWTGAWYESSCADIEVAAFHGACLSAVRRQGGLVRTDAGLISATPSNSGWIAETSAGTIEAGVLVNAAGAWGDQVAERAGVAPIGLIAKRRTIVQLRIGRTGLRDLPFVTDLHDSFYFKGEGDNSVWVCPLDETPVEPCDVAPEELDVAIAVDRFQRAVEWPVEAVERKWAGLRTFAPDDGMKFGFDSSSENFFWCVGQGGMGIQTAPAASRLCEALIRREALPATLAGIDPKDFVPRSLRAA